MNKVVNVSAPIPIQNRNNSRVGLVGGEFSTPVGTPEWSGRDCVEVWQYKFNQSEKLSKFNESKGDKLTADLFNPDLRLHPKSCMKNSDLWEKFPETKPGTPLIKKYLEQNRLTTNYFQMRDKKVSDGSDLLEFFGMD